MPHPFGPPTAEQQAVHDAEEGRDGVVVATADTIADLLGSMYAQGTIGAQDNADALAADFYLWALTQGFSADPSDPQQSAAYLAARAAEEERRAAPAGRTQFPSEAALDFATADLRRGQLRELVVNALLNAAPLAVGPEQEFFPGFEPGGAAQELASLLGVGVPQDPIQRITLPISDIAQ